MPRLAPCEGGREVDRVERRGVGSPLALTPIPPLFWESISQLLPWGYADHQSARPPWAAARGRKRESPRAARQPAKARRVPACLHHDAQEAEFGVAEGRPGPADQRLRGDGLHPGRRA